MPTYNEKDNIYQLIDETARTMSQYPDYICNILVVDDNSPDGTAQIVKNNMPILQEKYYNLRLHMLQREGKMGLGTAYIAGFKYALQNNADFIMEMDADFSHQPKYVPTFLDFAKNYDVVIGSRYVRGGGIENWSPIRKIISRGGGIYARLILGMNIQDLTGGYNLFRRNVLQSINLDKVKSNGYSFQIEIKYRCFKKGFKIREIPIIFPDRVNGKSKMNKKIFLEAIKMVWNIKFDKSITSKDQKSKLS